MAYNQSRSYNNEAPGNPYISSNINSGEATIAQIPPRRDLQNQSQSVPQQSARVPVPAYNNQYQYSNPQYSMQQQQHNQNNQGYNIVTNNNNNNNSQGPQPTMDQNYQQFQQQQTQQQQQYNHSQHHYGNNGSYPQQQQQPYVNTGTNMQQSMPHSQQGKYGQINMNGNANINTSASSMPSRRKVTLKLVILGNSGVGKTSLMNRYHSNKFTGQYKATIGADFLSKQVNISTPQNTSQPVTLTIWDTAGQERFQSLGKAFYRGSDVCILVYDVTDRMSFDGLKKWKEEFDSCLNTGGVNGGGMRMGMMQNRLHNGSVVGNQLKFIVIANKSDKDSVVAKEEGVAYARSIGSEFFECSAKTALNVEHAFVAAAGSGLEYNKQKQVSMNASMMMRGGNNGGGMREYAPPQRTVDLNRGQSSMSDDGNCC